MHDGPLQHITLRPTLARPVASAQLHIRSTAELAKWVAAHCCEESAVVEARRRLQVQRLARLWPRPSGQSVASTAPAAVHELEQAVSACDAACPEVGRAWYLPAHRSRSNHIAAVL